MPKSKREEPLVVVRPSKSVMLGFQIIYVSVFLLIILGALKLINYFLELDLLLLIVDSLKESYITISFLIPSLLGDIFEFVGHLVLDLFLGLVLFIMLVALFLANTRIEVFSGRVVFYRFFSKNVVMFSDVLCVKTDPVISSLDVGSVILELRDRDSIKLPYVLNLTSVTNSLSGFFGKGSKN